MLRVDFFFGGLDSRIGKHLG